MFNIGDIHYNSIKNINTPIGQFPLGIKGLTEDLIEENGGVINATQIDWNGAQLGDKEINTTGELLSH